MAYDANIDAYAPKHIRWSQLVQVNEPQLDILFFPEIPDEITVRNPPPSRRDVHTRRHPDEWRRGKQKRRQESLQSRANFSGASWLYKLHTHWGSHCRAVLHIKLVSYWRYCSEKSLFNASYLRSLKWYYKIWDHCWWDLMTWIILVSMLNAIWVVSPKILGRCQEHSYFVCYNCECSLRTFCTLMGGGTLTLQV